MKMTAPVPLAIRGAIVPVARPIPGTVSPHALSYGTTVIDGVVVPAPIPGTVSPYALAAAARASRSTSAHAPPPPEQSPSFPGVTALRTYPRPGARSVVPTAHLDVPHRTQQLFDGALELAATDKAPWVPGAFPGGLPSAQPLLTRPRPPGLAPTPHVLEPPPSLRVIAAERLQKITNQSQAAREGGLEGTDLGVPVQHGDQLYLFFGDATLVLPQRPDLWIRPMATVTAQPTNRLLGGLELTVHYLWKAIPPIPWWLPGTGGMRLASFDVLDVDNTLSNYSADLKKPQVAPQSFDVPTGGFSYAGRVHVFRMRKTGLVKYSVTHQALGTRYLVDAFSFLGVVGGRSVLESANDPSMFDATPSVSPLTPENAERAIEVCDIRNPDVVDNLRTKWKFSQVCPHVARGADIPELGTTGDVLLLWGTGAFRQSDVCFAWAPLSGKDIPLPAEWRYFSGSSGGRPQFTYGDMESAVGLLTWSDRSVQSNETSFERSEYLGFSWRPDPPAVGEFSVTYVPAFAAWLMLYTGPGTVVARLATKPWGPWGEPAVLLHSPGFYAPFALPTLTRWDAATQSVHLYFLGSFLTEGEDRNGRVFLYRAKLRLARPLSRTIPFGVRAPLGRF